MGSRNIKKYRKLLTVGITGIFGSGKTTVSSMFRKAGIPVISCDDIVHRLLIKKAVIDKLKRTFGRDIIKQGYVDRAILGKKVFSDTRERKKLEKILHPMVFREINKKILDSKKRGGIIAVEIPLLFETQSERLVDKIVLVKASRQTILKRLKGRYSRKEILERWNAQIPLKEKEKKSDYIINNSGEYSETFKEVQNLIKTLKSTAETYPRI